MDFVIVDAGRTAAFNAGISGIKIEIANFKLGSVAGYTPDPLVDTALHGTILHTGVPTGYSIINADTCEFLLEIPGNVGTFDFGEIGLYLSDGSLFAMQALPQLQQKIAFPGAGWNRILIRARLSLPALTPVIQWVVQNLTVGVIQELPNFSVLSRPSIAPSNIYIVHEADENGVEPTVTRAADDTWNVSTHTFKPVKAGDLSILPGATGGSMTVNQILPLDPTAPIGRYLIQIKTGPLKGLIRKVTNVLGAQMTWTPAFGSAPAAGEEFEILQTTTSILETEGSEISFFQAMSVRSVG